MAIGAYGTTIPINIASIDIPSLVDITYCYQENRTFDSLTNNNSAKSFWEQLGLYEIFARYVKSRGVISS